MTLKSDTILWIVKCLHTEITSHTHTHTVEHLLRWPKTFFDSQKQFILFNVNERRGSELVMSNEIVDSQIPVVCNLI